MLKYRSIIAVVTFCLKCYIQGCGVFQTSWSFSRSLTGDKIRTTLYRKYVYV